ncbi:30S ribosomal protein S27e [Sulfolobus acidocaldarius]|uniref:Small ribosomal subunit protein eS27 n=4 Tax=Sulfolobus acidocaldarius TaxID=2285 RepID=RS27_SULAC|nr:30S ribosomal protein S27e [Sulfolobus acidocaldarius]Q4J9B1.1 RecName: Full=Small ribosomal subunit protein eS27; AltName: Full=30S ribosomal protein S27e [Sulfolobus acidocaldarius DSM 639]AHC51554.1 30S ribosomal protein S27 [Sulfolobus acidocaldarius SUSAZ]AAY80618.1 SSU ribosomal protein S27E [Sulfolobus acidocaldarius DSM 639]AGE71210.1 30S ribosomal protein S27e [Sulfolobus acidocaldarius N8]AGE73480.1 30S ribosomal protein S27e [Sulfolobus acidocaldarius Ron12/I]ALU28531.1 30S ribo
MKAKFKILIPEPKSKFIRVKCRQCNNEQVIFSNATFPVRCLSCGAQIVIPKGGKAKIEGDTVRILG